MLNQEPVQRYVEFCMLPKARVGVPGPEATVSYPMLRGMAVLCSLTCLSVMLEFSSDCMHAEQILTRGTNGICGSRTRLHLAEGETAGGREGRGNYLVPAEGSPCAMH